MTVKATPTISRQIALTDSVILWLSFKNLIKNYAQNLRTCIQKMHFTKFTWTTIPRSNNNDTMKERTCMMIIVTMFFARWLHRSTSDWMSLITSIRLVYFSWYWVTSSMRQLLVKILNKTEIKAIMAMGITSRMKKKMYRMKNTWKKTKIKKTSTKRMMKLLKKNTLKNKNKTRKNNFSNSKDFKRIKTLMRKSKWTTKKTKTKITWWRNKNRKRKMIRLLLNSSRYQSETSSTTSTTSSWTTLPKITMHTNFKSSLSFLSTTSKNSFSYSSIGSPWKSM